MIERKMAEEPTVSVALVTYNHEAFIAQAVESVLSQQTSFDVEIVVGDDCSTDRTREILRALQKEHPNQIRLVLHEQNMGASRNFETTFQACRGNYIATLDGDDFWTSQDKLQLQVDAMESHPSWAVCSHKAFVKIEGEIHPPAVIPCFEPKPESALRDILRRNFAPSCANLYRSGVFDGFPDEYHSDVAGDWFLTVMHARRGRIGFLPDVMATYRVHSEGLYGRQSCAQRLRFQMQTVEKMLSILDDEHKKLARAAIADRRLSLGRVLRENGNFLGAMRQLTRSVGQYPLHWRTFTHQRLCAVALLLTPGFVLRHIRDGGGGAAFANAVCKRLLPWWIYVSPLREESAEA
jgi:glycosyltransferase involved in cell wall biosynthesis